MSRCGDDEESRICLLQLRSTTFIVETVADAEVRNRIRFGFVATGVVWIVIAIALVEVAVARIVVAVVTGILIEVEVVVVVVWANLVAIETYEVELIIRIAKVAIEMIEAKTIVMDDGVPLRIARVGHDDVAIDYSPIEAVAHVGVRTMDVEVGLSTRAMVAKEHLIELDVGVGGILAVVITVVAIFVVHAEVAFPCAIQSTCCPLVSRA